MPIKTLKEKILHLRAVGRSYREIEATLSCSRSTFHFHCSEAEWNDIGIKHNEVEEWYNFGDADGEPKQYGCSMSGIKREEKIKSGDIRKVIVYLFMGKLKKYE